MTEQPDLFSLPPEQAQSGCADGSPQERVLAPRCTAEPLIPPMPPNVQEPIEIEHGPLRAKAVQWMQDHPEVYATFERMALAMAARRRRFGINQLREAVRWDTMYRYEGERFKFCNSFSPYVARQLIADHPHLAEFMVCRKTKDEVERYG